MGSTGACRQRSVASNTAPSRLLAVSSGQNSRKSPPPSARLVRGVARRASARRAGGSSRAGRAPGAGRRRRSRPGRERAAGARGTGRRWRTGRRTSAGRRPGASAASSGTSRPSASNSCLGPVGPQPLLQLRAGARGSPAPGQRHLVGAEGALDLDAVHHVRARSSPWACAARSPASAWARRGTAGGPRGPAWISADPCRAPAAARRPARGTPCSGSSPATTHRRPALAAQVARRRSSSDDRPSTVGAADLVAVEVQDRQHGAVARGR